MVAIELRCPICGVAAHFMCWEAVIRQHPRVVEKAHESLEYFVVSSGADTSMESLRWAAESEPCLRDCHHQCALCLLAQSRQASSNISVRFPWRESAEGAEVGRVEAVAPELAPMSAVSPP